MSAKREYVVVGGKHNAYDENGVRKVYNPGDKILLTDEERGKFPDRFRAPEQPAPTVEEKVEEAAVAAAAKAPPGVTVSPTGIAKK